MSFGRVFINAKYCIFYAKKIYWDAKYEMQCVPGMHKVNRTLQCKVNFWWQKFCLGPLIQKWKGPWDSPWKFLLKTLFGIADIVCITQTTLKMVDHAVLVDNRTLGFTYSESVANLVTLVHWLLCNAVSVT